MTVARIVVDGVVKLDGSINEWVKRSPEDARQFLNPAEKPADPGMLALLVLVGMAAQGQKPIDVALTHGDGDDFELNVRYRVGKSTARPSASHGVLEHLNIKHGQQGKQAGRDFAEGIADTAGVLKAGDMCPGSGDPRCKGLCTIDGRTGVIRDPDCFR